ncbi:TraR/DksA C4-type zinc finger protein, partial [bacterium]|nr:TraR/DksA C4-type zinc finger protein [bacterium]
MVKKARLPKEVLSKLQKALLKKRARLMGNVEKLEEESFMNSQKDYSGDISGYKTHIADIGSDASGMELMLGLASNQQKLLQQVNDALARIEDGTYGLCQMCGKPIPQARLEAIPEAELCLNCA